MTIIQSFILAYCFLLSSFLLIRCRRSTAARYLVVALLILASAVAFNYAYEAGLIHAMPAWRWALPIWMGPVLFGLTTSLIQPLTTKEISRHVLVLSLPTLLVGSMPTLKNSLGFHFEVDVKHLGLSFAYLFLICYLGLSYRLIRRYASWLPQSIAASEVLQLRWLSHLLGLITVLVVIELIEWFAPLVLLPSSPYFYLIEMLFLALALLMLSLEIMQRPDGLLMHTASEAQQQAHLDQVVEHVSSEEHDVRAIHSSPQDLVTKQEDDAELSRLMANVNEKIVESELYKIPNLSLTQLAQEVALTPRELSSVINKVSKRNFSDFINAYRVREVARLLDGENAKNINLLDVLFQVGFNSKSTFNAMFKREFACTPSEYRKRSVNKAAINGALEPEKSP